MEFLNSLLYMLCEMAPYILLGFLIAGIMHAFVSQRTMSRHLSGSGLGPVVKAALIGVPLPLCSCGVLPTAIAMRRGGASKAASTSFLIATPQTGADSIAATWSLLGPAFAVVRPVAALATSVVGGVFVGKVDPEKDRMNGHGHCKDDECDARGQQTQPLSFRDRMVAALRYGFIDLVGSIGGWLVVGLLIAALITVYVPDSWFTVFADRPLLAMAVVLVIAIPMYVCATGSIPIAMSLMLKGLSPGTALVLLMAGPAANFASFTLISREMGRKAAVAYIGAIVAGAGGCGLLIDYLLPRQWFTFGSGGGACCHSVHSIGWFALTCGIVLALLLIYSFISNRLKNRSTINTQDMEKIITKYQVTGMNCPHCQATVKSRIESIEGVTAVDVNLTTGVATVEGSHDSAKLLEAIRTAGFNAETL